MKIADCYNTLRDYLKFLNRDSDNKPSIDNLYRAISIACDGLDRAERYAKWQNPESNSNYDDGHICVCLEKGDYAADKPFLARYGTSQDTGDDGWFSVDWKDEEKRNVWRYQIILGTYHDDKRYEGITDD